MASFNQAPLPCPLEVYCVAILSQIEQARKVKHVLCMNEVCAHVSRERAVHALCLQLQLVKDRARGCHSWCTRWPHQTPSPPSLQPSPTASRRRPRSPIPRANPQCRNGHNGRQLRRQNGALLPSNAATTRGVAMAFFDGSVETKNQKRHLNVFSTVVFVGARDGHKRTARGPFRRASSTCLPHLGERPLDIGKRLLPTR